MEALIKEIEQMEKSKTAESVDNSTDNVIKNTSCNLTVQKSMEAQDDLVVKQTKMSDQSLKMMPFTCKLCGLGIGNDREIKMHMINHVERVLAEDEKAEKSEKELASKLAAIEESEENTDTEDFTEEQSVAIADAYLAKCDADGNYIG